MDPEKKQSASHAFVQVDAVSRNNLWCAKYLARLFPSLERMPLR
jgi:hypothetical protein